MCEISLAPCCAVDREDFAGDVAGEVTSEEKEGVGDVAGLADAAEGDGFDERFDDFGRELRDHVGVCDAGGDGVDADATRG